MIKQWLATCHFNYISIGIDSLFVILAAGDDLALTEEQIAADEKFIAKTEALIDRLFLLIYGCA
jgi:hypothetical protein